MGLTITYELKDFKKGELVDKYGMGENGNLRLFLANTCFRRMHKYTPFDTGTLASTATIEPGKITYEVPYAHYMYVGKTKSGEDINYRKAKHRLAGKEWDKRMFNAEEELIVQELEAEAKRLGG